MFSLSLSSPIAKQEGKLLYGFLSCLLLQDLNMQAIPDQIRFAAWKYLFEHSHKILHCLPQFQTALGGGLLWRNEIHTYIQEPLPGIKALLAEGKSQWKVVEHYGFKDKYVVKQ